jgi:Flp pilus assembly protein TadD
MTNAFPNFVRRNKDLFVIAALTLLVAAIYFQATSFGFINLDDNLYVYDNPALGSGLNWESFKWAFTSFWSANWHPLTWLSHALDVSAFGMNSGSHHAMNVLFHLLNSILAFVVFQKMTGRAFESAVVAALFAVHPAHVESVAWISERKDVLSTMLWLLTMWAYVRYVRVAGESATQNERNFSTRILSYEYLVVVGLFALGLMAKPMLVTLPFVLLLCDYWPLGRLHKLNDIWRLIFEKLPLFVLTAASCVMTFWAQRSAGAVESLDFLPLSTRAINALVAYAKYIVMLFYPADLAVYYPYDRELAPWQITGSVILLLSVTALCIWQIKRRPFLIVGWLWFLGTLVPVIGIMQVGSQSLADRYTYVPYFGLFVMLIWGALSLVDDRTFGRRAFTAACLTGILVLTGFAIRQASHWRSNETLYRHTLAVTNNNYVIAHNLCHAFVLQDRLDEAEPLCRQAIEMKPDYNEPYNTLGILEFKRGKFAEAEADFKDSLRYAPQYGFALINLAQAQSRQGKAAEAEESLRLAVENSGGSASGIFSAALSDVASAYAAEQNYEKYAENLKRLLYIEPQNADVRSRLATTLCYLRRYEEAAIEARSALNIKPDSAEAWNALGIASLATNANQDAIAAFEQVVNISPDFPEAKANLERARAKVNASTKNK